MSPDQITHAAAHLPLFLKGNLALALLLFAIGIAGFFVKQNAISLFMCIELMINAANLVFVSFALLHGNATGAIAFLFVVTVAAAEAGVGLAIFISMSRTDEGIDVDRTTSLAETTPQAPAAERSEPAAASAKAA